MKNRLIIIMLFMGLGLTCRPSEDRVFPDSQEKTLIHNTQDTTNDDYVYNIGNTSNNYPLCLINNIPIEQKGVIKSLKLNAFEDKDLEVLILERKTNSVKTPTNGNSETFEVKSVTVIAANVGLHDYIVNINVERGNYVGYRQKDNTQRIPYFGTKTTVDSNGWWQSSSAGNTDLYSFVEYGWVSGGVVVEFNTYVTQEEIEPKYVDLHVVRNEANYNSIREAMSAITDASYFKRYRLLVLNGSWFESDIIGKDYVEIVGQDKYLTRLYCDGASNNLTPSDYSFTDYSNMPLSSLPQSLKHCFNARNNIKASNLTVEVNDAKYCAHLDYNGSNKLVEFENCRFYTGENVNYNIGIGLYGGQKVRFENCEFERNVDGFKAIFFHNWNNQSEGVLLSIKNSDFKNCSYLLLDELGSEQEDLVELINCKSDIEADVEWMVDSASDGLTGWVNPKTGLREANPTKLPYCIKLNSIGTTIAHMASRAYPYGSFGSARPKYKNYVNGELNTFHFSKSQFEPSSPGDIGKKGEIRIIGEYVYFCIAENTWKQIKLNDVTSKL